MSASASQGAGKSGGASVGVAAPGVFARKSSGLVRTISTFDTFFYCLVQLAIPFVIFNIAVWAFYPGANMEIASLIALAAAVLEGVTYGLFISVYPRSGGEYVPLSRATHPLIGFIASFSQTWWQTYVTGTIVAFACSLGWAPLLTMIGLQTGNQGLINLGLWFDSSWGWFLFGSIAIGLFSYQLYRGMRTYFRVQRWLFALALAGWVILIIVMLLGYAGVFDFQANLDKYAGAGATTGLLEAARAADVDLSPAFSWPATLEFTIWPAYLFLFAVLSTAFSGEVKNVARGQLIAIPTAQLVGGALVILASLAARLGIGNQILLAVSGVPPEQSPLAYNWLTMLASVLADNILLTIIISLSALILTTYVAASTAIYATRGLLAWGIDGMAPSKLADVSEKHHSPTYSILVVALLSIAVLAIYSFTDWFRWLAALAPMSMVFLLTTVVGALFPFMRRKDYENSPAKVEVAGIPLMTITGVLGGIIMAYMVYRALVDSTFGSADPRQLAIMIGVFVLGGVWYFVARAVRARQGVNMRARFEEIPIE
jgi:amino acid transporter